MTRLSFLAATVLLLAGCSHTVQTTSGADYLSKRAPLAAQPIRAVSSTYTAARGVTDRPITELIREAASVEPLLTFPARFGLARIEDGNLTTIPPGEAALWNAMAARFEGFGSFTMVDPIIVEFTSNSLPPATHQALLRQDRDGSYRSYRKRDLPTKIRLGAARQHLDAVLIYEVGMEEKRGRRPLTSVRLSALGGMPLSDHTVDAAGAAKAILLDVRNAYPYGTAQIQKDLSGYADTWHTTSARSERREKARKSIAAALVPDVENMLRSLINRLQAKQLRAQQS